MALRLVLLTASLHLAQSLLPSSDSSLEDLNRCLKTDSDSSQAEFLHLLQHRSDGDFQGGRTRSLPPTCLPSFDATNMKYSQSVPCGIIEEVMDAAGFVADRRVVTTGTPCCGKCVMNDNSWIYRAATGERLAFCASCNEVGGQCEDGKGDTNLCCNSGSPCLELTDRCKCSEPGGRCVNARDCCASKNSLCVFEAGGALGVCKNVVTELTFAFDKESRFTKLISSVPAWPGWTDDQLKRENNDANNGDELAQLQLTVELALRLARGTLTTADRVKLGLPRA